MRKNRVLILLLTLVFAYRLLILINSGQSFYSDDAIYAEIARFWTQGKLSLVFHPTWPPLYPLLSTFVYLITQNWEFSLRLLSLISFLAMLVFLYYFVDKTLGRLNAIFYTLSIGFFTPILKASIYPQSDMLASFLVIAGVITYLFAIRNLRYSVFLISGVIFGLTFLVRSEGTLFFSLSLSFLCIHFLCKFLSRKVKFKKAFFSLLIFTSSFLAVASPYIIATSYQLGELTLSQKFSAQIKQGHAFQIQKNGTTWSQEVVSVKTPNYNSEYFRGGFVFLLENIEWFVFWFNQKYTLWQKMFLSIFPGFALLVILLGIIRLTKKYFWETLYLLYLLCLGIIVTVFATPLADIRYLLWTLPIFLFFFFAGFSNFPFVAFIAFLFFPSLSISTILNPLEYARGYTANHYRKEIIQASNWINNNKKTQEPRIMTRYENIEFYSDGNTVYLPQELTYVQMIEYAKRQKVDYFIAWTETLSNENNLVFLLEENADTPGLNKVFSTYSNSRALIIYEVVF